MILNKQQQIEFETVARPLIEWLNKNCHPHVAVIVKPGSVELTEGVYFVPIKGWEIFRCTVCGCDEEQE